MGSRTPAFAREIIEANDTDLARKVNASLIHRARERVYGRIKRGFVEKVWRAAHEERAAATGQPHHPAVDE